MDATTLAERETTLFVTDDNQAVHEIGEDDEGTAFIVGSLVVTEGELVKKRGRWHLRGSIPLRLTDRRWE